MYVILWIIVVSKVDVVPHTEVGYNAEAEYEITPKCRSPPEKTQSTTSLLLK